MMVILYSTDCPKCQILKEKLDNKNIEYIVNSDSEAMLLKGFSTVPMLEIDSKVLNYLDAVKWVKEQ